MEPLSSAGSVQSFLAQKRLTTTLRLSLRVRPLSSIGELSTLWRYRSFRLRQIVHQRSAPKSELLQLGAVLGTTFPTIAEMEATGAASAAASDAQRTALAPPPSFAAGVGGPPVPVAEGEAARPPAAKAALQVGPARSRGPPHERLPTLMEPSKRPLRRASYRNLRICNGVLG